MTNNKDLGYLPVPQIKVENTRKAASIIAAEFYGYPTKDLTVIGITGTNGKTTTASIIRSILVNAGIKTAQIAYDAAFDTYIQISSWTPDSNITKTQRSWNSGTNFDTLGWGPDGKVRGRYKVESTSTTDFLVTGECDVDNDDDNASFTATKSLNTKMNTGATAY